MTVNPSWQLASALALLVLLTVIVSWRARLHLVGEEVIAVVRAIAQLGAASLVIGWAVEQLWSTCCVVAVMFLVAVRTTARRTGVGRRWWWPAVAMLAGAIPVSLVTFGSGLLPLHGIAIIPVMGILIGNLMTAHTLAGRRMFSALRDDRSTYEGVLALGLPASTAIGVITAPLRREALVPNLDQTRTVGLVTLPGAYVGVLLGGGSALQAGAAQVLVLVMIMTGQTIVVTVMERLVRAGLDLPDDLVESGSLPD